MSLICSISGECRNASFQPCRGPKLELTLSTNRHMRQLEQAKKAFPNTYLLVGIPNDTETHKRKGLTVLTDQERAETLRHCKWVDEVLENAPWIVTPEFLTKHSIDYVAHDDEPYACADSDDIYRPCKEAGKFLVTQRTEGISTTYIITKYGAFFFSCDAGVIKTPCNNTTGRLITSGECPIV